MTGDEDHDPLGERMRQSRVIAERERRADVESLDDRIVSILSERDHALDHESLWLGYCTDFEPEAVRRAINRLKRRGVIVAMQRGWYAIASTASEPRDA
jgi:predicted transcriptional regulator of viral defense system